MRVFKVRVFTRFQRRERISDEALAAAVARAERGLVDADLGGGLIKQRVARPGQGRSGGYRTVIAYRHGDRAMFLLGFAKNARANIDEDEVDVLRGQARAFLRLTEDRIAEALGIGELTEIEYGDEDETASNG